LIQTLDEKLAGVESAYADVCSENSLLKSRLQETRAEIDRIRAEKNDRKISGSCTSPIPSRKSSLMDSAWGIIDVDGTNQDHQHHGVQDPDTGQKNCEAKSKREVSTQHQPDGPSKG